MASYRNGKQKNIHQKHREARLFHSSGVAIVCVCVFGCML